MPRRRLIVNPHASEGELFVPVAQLLHTVPPGTTLKDLEDLPHLLGGRAVKLKAPLVVRGDDGVVTLIPGFGEAEAGELQELAQAAVERHRARIARNRGRIIGEETRARLGMVPYEQFDAAFREALEDRVRHHQTHPVSDPARRPGEPARPNPY